MHVVSFFCVVHFDFFSYFQFFYFSSKRRLSIPAMYVQSYVHYIQAS